MVIAGVATAAAAAFLAFGVFGVQTLFTDDKVSEDGPDFASGAEVSDAVTTTTAAPTGSSPAAAPSSSVPPTSGAAAVTTAATGSFKGVDHPGEGTVSLLTDGTQTFVRFEDDFSTDNGPDLYAVAYVGGERIELGKLKGNQGSQNYELPAGTDASAVETIAVWCKRFDATFTEATLNS